MSLPSIFPLGPNRVWRTYQGGRFLDALQGVNSPSDSHFPEDWIASTTRATNKGREAFETEGLSSVQVDGQSILLRDLFAQFPGEMLGPRHYERYGAQTGVLTKFLDSAIRLPMQCHPTIAFSQQHLNANAGKTEAYVILKTREDVKDPYVYLGFERPPDPREFARWIEQQEIERILGCCNRVPVRQGDVFLVPGGMPHAIGEGVFMIEIMEPTDFAVRIEFTCGDYVLPEESRFMGRDVDFAVSMFDFRATTPEDIRERLFGKPRVIACYGQKGEETSLIDKRMTECFSVHRLAVKGEVVRPTNGFYVLIVTRGEGTIESPSGERYSLRFGDRFFVAAHSEQVRVRSEKGLQAILTFPPA